MTTIHPIFLWAPGIFLFITALVVTLIVVLIQEYQRERAVNEGYSWGKLWLEILKRWNQPPMLKRVFTLGTISFLILYLLELAALNGLVSLFTAIGNINEVTKRADAQTVQECIDTIAVNENFKTGEFHTDCDGYLDIDATIKENLIQSSGVYTATTVYYNLEDPNYHGRDVTETYVQVDFANGKKIWCYLYQGGLDVCSEELPLYIEKLIHPPLSPTPAVIAP